MPSFNTGVRTITVKVSDEGITGWSEGSTGGSRGASAPLKWTGAVAMGTQSVTPWTELRDAHDYWLLASDQGACVTGFLTPSQVNHAGYMDGSAVASGRSCSDIRTAIFR